MMKVSVKVDIDPKLMKKRAHEADLVLATQAMLDTEPFVPFRTGSQANRSQVFTQAEPDTEPLRKRAEKATKEANDAGQAVIIYPGPYSHYLYEGIVRADPKTGAAGFLTEDGWKSRKNVRKVLTDRNLVLAHSGADPEAQPKWFEVSKAMNMDKWLRVYGKALSNGD